MRYSIKVKKSGRYINSFWKEWYESCAEEVMLFTREQVDEFIANMEHYFIYRIVVTGENGSSENVDIIGNRYKAVDGDFWDDEI